MFEVTERLYKTTEDKIVTEGHPDARWLYAVPGNQVPDQEAERYGLLEADASDPSGQSGDPAGDDGSDDGNKSDASDPAGQSGDPAGDDGNKKSAAKKGGFLGKKK